MRGTLREPAMNKSALPRVLAVIVTTGAMVVGSVVLQARSFAGSWPEHTVRIITPFSPGISVDVAARALADALAKRWKQPVVVENRPGADTIIGPQAFLESGAAHPLPFTPPSP